MLFVVTDGSGNVAVIAVSWVEFRGRAAARRLLEISDTWGTGYVKPMAGAALAVGDIRLTGQHYASRLAGTVVVAAEVRRHGPSAACT